MSDAIVAVRSLLKADAALTALVPATRIVAGSLPIGTATPAISIELVSGVPRNILAPGSTRRVNARVEVGVLAGSYPELREVLKAVRKAAADKAPTVSGLENVTVHSLGEGPDFENAEAGLYGGSEDLRVRYRETR